MGTGTALSLNNDLLGSPRLGVDTVCSTQLTEQCQPSFEATKWPTAELNRALL